MNLIIIVPLIVIISIITFGILVKLLGAVPKKYHKSGNRGTKSGNRATKSGNRETRSGNRETKSGNKKNRI